jgi:hypothetical protein
VDELDDVVRRGPLALNPLTYQVSLEGGTLDLTFMEYELLKLLMGYPGRVYTREEILLFVRVTTISMGCGPWMCTFAASARSSARITRG